MAKNTTYGIKRKVTLSYEEAITKVTATLKEEGFGILTEIDVKETLKKKIGKDFTKYIILGACNPPIAFQALTEEIDIGLLLPCNVIIYEEPTSKDVIIAAIDPKVLVQVTQREDLGEMVEIVRGKLTRAIENV